MLPTDEKLIAELRADEGVEYSPYIDTVGIKTVGVGHNLKSSPIANAEYPLTDEQVDNLLANDLKIVFNGLDKNLPWWRELSYVRQRVLANMAFNLGISGLLGFTNTLDLIKKGEYAKAANGMLASKWAGQVGARAKRLAMMMITG